MDSLVKVVQDPIKGRILIAAKDLLAGQAIVRERPLIAAMNNIEDMLRYEAETPPLITPGVSVGLRWLHAWHHPV